MPPARMHRSCPRATPRARGTRRRRDGPRLHFANAACSVDCEVQERYFGAASLSAVFGCGAAVWASDGAGAGVAAPVGGVDAGAGVVEAGAGAGARMRTHGQNDSCAH